MTLYVALHMRVDKNFKYHFHTHVKCSMFILTWACKIRTNQINFLSIWRIWFWTELFLNIVQQIVFKFRWIENQWKFHLLWSMQLQLLISIWVSKRRRIFLEIYLHTCETNKLFNKVGFLGNFTFDKVKTLFFRSQSASNFS